jgi:hypothetical protein
MSKKKTSTALPPEPHTVRVAVHAPKVSDAAGLCTLGNKCIAGGAANPKTIGLSSYLPQITTGVSTVQPLIEPASGGGLVERANLRAAAKVLRTAIVGHGAWVDNQGVQIHPGRTMIGILELSKKSQRELIVELESTGRRQDVLARVAGTSAKRRYEHRAQRDGRRASAAGV